MCVEHVEQYSGILQYLLNFAAIRTVPEGHQMVADGWRLFEEAIASMGAGDLPQLLRNVRTMTTPPPPPPPPQPSPQPEGTSTGPDAGTPTPMDVGPGTSVASPVKTEGEDPVLVMVGGSRHWACPRCSTIRGSRNGCDAHIRQAHTGKVLVCGLCSFSTYNLDSLQRHSKTHN